MHGCQRIVYFKEIESTLQTVPFTTMDGQPSDADPKMLYSGNTFYETLADSHIKSYSFLHRSIVKSKYSAIMTRGSTNVSYVRPSDAVINLRKALQDEKNTAYFYFYLDAIDQVEHKYGPNTEESKAEIDAFSYVLENQLLKRINHKTAEETLVLITADHGQTFTDPKDTIYLDRDKTITEMFERNSKNEVIPPTGSARDVFLHIKADKLDKAHAYLSKKLKDDALVMTSDEALRKGLFGRGAQKREFYDRIGNLLVLPYKNKTVWYEIAPSKKYKHPGMHGGLYREEMLVPFGIARLADLVKD